MLILKLNQQEATMKIFLFLGNLFDRLCIVIGAFLGSQIPSFIQQYTQRLAGHVEALQKLVTQMHQIALLSHKSLEQYIQKFQNSTDPDFTQQGEFMQGILIRWQELSQTLEHLTQSPFWLHYYYFIKDIQIDIAQSTFASFQPSLNLTIEGLCFAMIGMILGWTIYQIISKCIVFGYKRVQVTFK